MQNNCKNLKNIKYLAIFKMVILVLLIFVLTQNFLSMLQMANINFTMHLQEKIIADMIINSNLIIKLYKAIMLLLVFLCLATCFYCYLTIARTKTIENANNANKNEKVKFNFSNTKNIKKQFLKTLNCRLNI